MGEQVIQSRRLVAETPTAAHRLNNIIRPYTLRYVLRSVVTFLEIDLHRIQPVV
jgi:hypothetical protein